MKKVLSKQKNDLLNKPFHQLSVDEICLLLNNFEDLLLVLKNVPSFAKLNASYYEQLKSFKTIAITNNKVLTKKEEKDFKKQAKQQLIQAKKELKTFWNHAKEAYKEQKAKLNSQYKNHESSEYLDQIQKINKSYQAINEYVNLHSSLNAKYFSTDIDEYQKMENKPILFVRNLTKYYKKKKTSTTDCLSFDIYPGEFHAFIGANGAGKTTTIKSLITSYHQWSGTILINGIPNEKEDAKRKIGYIPEKATFPDHLSAFNYLKWMIMLSNFSKEEAEKIAEEKLKELGMWDLRKRSPNTFSSGQKKKILLAQALTHNPDIIIMDEPVANLDPKARIEFFDKLLMLKKQGKAIFISSHVLAELDLYADSLTILDGGKIIYSGNKDNLLEKYNKHECIVSFNDKYQDKVFSFFKKQKIAYKKMIEKPNEFIITISKQNNIQSIQKWFATNKIPFEKFQWHKPTLEDIYKNMIILGSKDTMVESNVAKKEAK